MSAQETSAGLRLIQCGQGPGSVGVNRQLWGASNVERSYKVEPRDSDTSK